MLIGFNWAGWTLGSTAEQNAEASAATARVAVLARADRFQHASGATAELVALKAVDSWERETFVAKGGWATFPGSKEPADGVAAACAKLLTAKK